MEGTYSQSAANNAVVPRAPALHSSFMSMSMLSVRFPLNPCVFVGSDFVLDGETSAVMDGANEPPSGDMDHFTARKGRITGSNSGSSSSSSTLVASTLRCLTTEIA